MSRQTVSEIDLKLMQERIADKNKHLQRPLSRILTAKGAWYPPTITRINIKPLSVNEAWQGRRFKTEKYKVYSAAVSQILPNTISLPTAPYHIYFKFGFSSLASDWDNCIKPAQDILAARYKFNDKLIRKATVETEIVKKGEEYFEFQITSL